MGTLRPRLLFCQGRGLWGLRFCLGWGLGLAKSSSPRAQEVAFQLAQNWIRTNFDVYSQKSAMYEKVSWHGAFLSLTVLPQVRWGRVRLGRPRTVAAPSSLSQSLQRPELQARASPRGSKAGCLGLEWWLGDSS